jgi:hypothetical protein
LGLKEAAAYGQGTQNTVDESSEQRSHDGVILQPHLVLEKHIYMQISTYKEVMRHKKETRLVEVNTLG